MLSKIIAVFILNTIFTFFYGNLLSLPLEFSEFPAKGDTGCLNIIQMCYIPDIYVYLEYIINSNFNIIDDLKAGLTVSHLLLYKFVAPKNIIIYSILINSLILSISFGVAFLKRSDAIKCYLYFSPFFIFYSYGPTKEIIQTSAMIIFLSNQFNQKKIYYVPIFLMILSRPQYLILFVFDKYLKKRFFTLFIFLLFLFSPFFLLILGNEWVSRGDPFYDLQSNQSITRHIDVLRFSTPILSIFGWITVVIKTILEPLVLFVDYGHSTYDLFLYTSILTYLAFIAILYKNKFTFKYMDKQYLLNFIALYFIISCYVPFIHSRYILPMIVSVSISIFISKQCAVKNG